ncbi:NAC domain-containing protein 91-like isoform X2 [Carica papaya]|uniref:NAC domain-containing protein 91-like isoform X2 n=1 Tax=Carica papaya TaxID=3649 RepID=UPI000B8D166B|nr:NAC domain-containing protein 91-like isoform X2 [Carica papaya]
MKIDTRMNLQARKVEPKTRSDTPDCSIIIKVHIKLLEGAWNIGYRFTPSDEELLQILAIKLRGEYEILGGHAVKEIDVYQKEPWLVFDKDESEPFYVKKNSSKSRMDRKFASGTWRMERSIDVVDQGDKVVGYKKMLTFEEKKKKKNSENVLPSNGVSGHKL